MMSYHRSNIPKAGEIWTDKNGYVIMRVNSVSSGYVYHTPGNTCGIRNSCSTDLNVFLKYFTLISSVHHNPQCETCVYDYEEKPREITEADVRDGAVFEHKDTGALFVVHYYGAGQWMILCRALGGTWGLQSLVNVTKTLNAYFKLTTHRVAILDVDGKEVE